VMIAKRSRTAYESAKREWAALDCDESIKGERAAPDCDENIKGERAAPDCVENIKGKWAAPDCVESINRGRLFLLDNCYFNISPGNIELDRCKTLTRYSALQSQRHTKQEEFRKSMPVFGLVAASEAYETEIFPKEYASPWTGHSPRGIRNRKNSEKSMPVFGLVAAIEA